MRFIAFSFLVALLTGKAEAADITRYHSDEKGFAVNSWLVPTSSGLIVIDTQFTVSEAEKLVKALAETGRPLKGIVITHPHPDHFNGTCQLLKLAHVPVYATEHTISAIKATESAKRAEWKPTYGSDYPDSTCLPDQTVPASGKVQIDGLELEFRDFGAGEASDETLIFAPALKAVFPGDLIYNELHPWLAEGRSALWLAQLERLKTETPEGSTLYPGHGEASGPSVIEAQQRYITSFRDAIRSKLKPDGLSKDDSAEIVQTFQNRYSGWPLQMLVPMNVTAVAKELSGQK